MPVRFEPLEDEHSILLVFSEPWEMNDFIGHFKRMRQYLDEAKQPLHFIVDLSAVRHDPQGVLRFRQAPAFSHPQTGYIVYVTRDSTTRQFLEMGMRVIRFERAMFFTARDEAREFLRTKQPHL